MDCISSIVRVNLKSGFGEIVPRWRSNVPWLLKNFVKQVTGKIVPRWDRNVARWCARGEKTETYFSVQICSKF